MKVVAFTVAVIAIIGRIAHASCKDEPDFTHKVRLPLLVTGIGAASNGNGPFIAVGYGRGSRDHCDEGYEISRMLVGAHFGNTTQLSLTYGWYETMVGSMGFDFGLEGDRFAGGPIARLTLGANAFGIRLTGGMRFANNTELVGAIELVLDVADLVDVLTR